MRAFVKYYDTFYQDKSRFNDVELLVKLLPQSENLNVLEIGGGTGEHTKILSEKFNSVYSIETDSEMRIVANQKLNNVSNIHILSEVNKAPMCDSACAFFYVINYITTSESLLSFFKSIRARLAPQSVFLLDGWNGQFAWQSGSLSTEREFSQNPEKLKLTTTTNIKNKNAEMIFEIEEGVENHKQKHIEKLPIVLWSPNEIKNIALEAGFAQCDFYSRNDIENKLAEADRFFWGVLKT